LKKWCRCGGSIESTFVERDSVRKKQLLQPLLMVERSLLHPNVEFVWRLGVMVDLDERQLRAQAVALPLVRLGVDQLREEERFVRFVQLLLNQLDAVLCSTVRFFASDRRWSQTKRIRSLTM
jgi:hypothetical protein